MLGKLCVLTMCFTIAVLTVAGNFAAHASVSEARIHYTTVTVKKTAPYELSLSFPRFVGEPSERVIKLNKWIKQKIPTCGGGRKDNKNSLVDVSLEVLKLNDEVAVIKESGETYCDGNAHPNHGLYYHFISIKTVRPVDLWNELTAKGKQSIIQRIVKAGQAIPDDDDCNILFTADSMQDRFVSVEYKDEHTLTLLPSFPHVAQACEDRAETDFAIDELKKHFAPQSPAFAVLDGLQH